MFFPRVVEGGRPYRVTSGAPAHTPPVVAEAIAELQALFAPPLPLTAEQRAPAAALARDLAYALAELARGKRPRAVLSTAAPTTVCEIVLERDAASVRTSLYRPGALPLLGPATSSHSMASAAEMITRAIDALEPRRPDEPAVRGGGLLEPASSPESGLALARAQLVDAVQRPCPHAGLAVRPVSIQSGARGPLVVRATIDWTDRPETEPVGTELRRADLYPLLFLGDVELRVGECRHRLSRVHVFLLAEQLAAIAGTMLEARAAGRSMLCRRRVGMASCGIQLDAQGNATLIVDGRGGDRGSRLPPLPSSELAKGIAGFGRSLVRTVRGLDRSQRANLRLSGLASAVRRLDQQRKGTTGARSIVNRAPESYRAFAEGEPCVDELPKEGPSTPAEGARVGRLRFEETWRAAIGGLDLKSIHLCGAGLVVGSSREIACLDRATGDVVWRRSSPRALSLPTPGGLVRLSPAGRVALHALEDGEPLAEVSIRPCVGAAISGLVVYAAGLPHMLLVAEAPSHLVAIDLDAGEVRWRRSMGQREKLQLRRAGKLVIVGRGDEVLTALDVLTGEVVWRHVGPVGFDHVASVEHNELYVAGSAGRARTGPVTLYRIDPWSGAASWQCELPRGVRLLGPPRLGPDVVVLVIGDDSGAGLATVERRDGTLRYVRRGSIGMGVTGCMVVDDVVVANSEAGGIVGISLADGSVRYRHVLDSDRCDDCAGSVDRPRSLEPVLRCGALFVPRSELKVLRPSDGAIIGTVPSDLIPDVVRVDERCGVYLAEQAGHLAAFAALPTLRLLSSSGAKR